MTNLAKRRAIFVMIAANVVATTASAFADDQKTAAKKPTKQRGPGFTISKATTRITKPLTKDGYVDYVAALNQQLSRGVTPDVNAAVHLWKAMGVESVEDWTEERRKKFFKMLAMKQPKAGDAQYVSVEDFVSKTEDTPKEREDVNDKIWRDRDMAMSRPWSEEVYPELAAWLAANERAINLAVAASVKPRYYSPIIADDEDFAMMGALPVINPIRDMARLLLLRAMQSTAAGKTDAAWNDLLACWRLGRLVGKGPTLIDLLIGIALEGMAADGTISFIHHSKLSDRQIAAMRADVHALSKRDMMIDKIDVGERYYFLDALQSFEQKGSDALETLDALSGTFTFVDAVAFLQLADKEPKKIGFSKALRKLLIRATIDWDFILRDGNGWYDRMVKIGRMPRGPEQSKAFEELDEEMRRMWARRADPKSIVTDLLSGKSPRRMASERLSGTFINLLLPAANAALHAEHRADMYIEMVDTAFALKLHHNKHGKYPAKFDALVPKYLKAVPVDINTEKAQVRYKKTTAGFLLYSVGRDGKDQGGPYLDNDDREDVDDIGFRVPAK